MEVADHLVDCVVSADVLTLNHRFTRTVEGNCCMDGTCCPEQRLVTTDPVSKACQKVQVERLDLKRLQPFGQFLDCEGTTQATR